MKIQDGTGSGKELKVDSNNRAHTHAVVRTEAVNSSKKGEAFNIHSGSISFTAAGSLIYVKNDEENDLVIEGIIFAFGEASVSDSLEVTLTRNITAGNLLTDETPVDFKPNRNYGSNKGLIADMYKGKSGGTIVGGEASGLFFLRPASRTFAEVNLTLPRGASLALTLDPKLSSGTVKSYIVLVSHIADPANEDDNV